MLEPKGRVVMISGAARGIGLAVAQQLRNAGYSLSLGAREQTALEDAFGSSVGPTLSLHPYDADEPAGAQAWVEATLSSHGRIDGLVNNAGIFRKYQLESGDEADLDAMWRVNVKGPLALIRQAWPHLKAAGSGRVINLASMSGKRIAGVSLGYSLSKYAVMALTHQARLDGWDHGIRATAICPGFVATDMAYSITDEAGETMTQPEDVAALVETALALPNTAAVPEIMVNYRYELVF
ncbi:MAG: SDR family NAD(P)-dependent oxidoreductase [Pseudomonadota bacterium]